MVAKIDKPKEGLNKCGWLRKGRSRPEGPTFNSHAREGVVTTALKKFEARRAGTSCLAISSIIPFVPRLRRSLARKFLSHALTGVAIECRPFGPKLRKLASASTSSSAAHRLVQGFLKFVGQFALSAFGALAFIIVAASLISAQNPAPNTETLKKANTRPPVEATVAKSDPFDGASVEKMTGQCVSLDTEVGMIVIEMLPTAAPESVRSFLNLAATGALDTTVFSRVVKGFVIQGGNLSTNEKWNAELAARMSRHLPDEPSKVSHVRGIVSMARGDEPNSATTHFFILVGDGPHLDGKFAAFGRVIRGIEVADAINHAPVENEKPVVPVRIKTAVVAQCQK